MRCRPRSPGCRRASSAASTWPSSSPAGPNLIIFDEPTNHLSATLVDELTEAIRGTGAAVVLATHDRQLLRDLADWPRRHLTAPATSSGRARQPLRKPG